MSGISSNGLGNSKVGNAREPRGFAAVGPGNEATALLGAEDGRTEAGPGKAAPRKSNCRRTSGG